MTFLIPTAFPFPLPGRRKGRPRGGLTATYAELFFQSNADHTAVASTAAEATLLAGTNKQPFVPKFSMKDNGPHAKGYSVHAAGVLGTTGTPTLTFKVRMGTTVGAASLAGTVLGTTAAITAGTGVTTKQWELWFHVQVNTFGSGGTNTTLSCYGWVDSPTGLVTPFKYAIQPTSPESGTWTTAVDGGLDQYLNLSATWSASDAANTITCKALRGYCWN